MSSVNVLSLPRDLEVSLAQYCDIMVIHCKHQMHGQLLLDVEIQYDKQPISLHSVRTASYRTGLRPHCLLAFYPRDATCLSVRPSVRLSHAGIVSKRRKLVA